MNVLKECHFENDFTMQYFKITRVSDLYLRHAPSYEKHALCQQIRNAEFDVYQAIFDYSYARAIDKRKCLTKLYKSIKYLIIVWYLFFQKNYLKYFKGRPRWSSKKELSKAQILITLFTDFEKLVKKEFNSLV